MDEESNRRNEVPSQTLKIMRISKRKVYAADNPEVDAFIVWTGTNPSVPFRLWTTMEWRERIARAYPGLRQDDITASFAKGTPMVNLEWYVHTCGGADRPAELWRVVCEGQYAEGMMARGVEFDVDNNAARFHRHLQMHFRQSGRANKSPYMSATSDEDEVPSIIEHFKSQGYTPIKVIHFRTTGPGWDHSKQRLWHVPSLGRDLRNNNWSNNARYMNEYLLEDRIPPESVIDELELDLDDAHIPDAEESDHAEILDSDIEVEEDVKVIRPHLRASGFGWRSAGWRGQQMARISGVIRNVRPRTTKFKNRV
ncbi:hypothetical protein F5Y16DRAFT_353760 [Xylariaceae sp. FL0255]|nr:hypothetical protein F5Y16DRAFT_353760 [Xylariaceae sp. FL0255]